MVFDSCHLYPTRCLLSGEKLIGAIVTSFNSWGIDKTRQIRVHCQFDCHRRFVNQCETIQIVKWRKNALAHRETSNWWKTCHFPVIWPIASHKKYEREIFEEGIFEGRKSDFRRIHQADVRNAKGPTSQASPKPYKKTHRTEQFWKTKYQKSCRHF